MGEIRDHTTTVRDLPAGVRQRDASSVTEMSGQTVLEARSLAVGYDGKPLVQGIELEARLGQVVTLIGPNGAGKSTMLKTLAGHLAPCGGAVYLTGRDLSGLPVTERARELSVLLTDRVRTDLLTCIDVVEMGRHPHTGRLGMLTDEDRAQVRAAMELVHVWDLRHRDFMRLSDGQRQRVMLARAICQQPRVLILDEPTNYLDIRYQIELLDILRRLVEDREMGIVMSLHELPLARVASDWLVCVKDGAVLAQGTPEEVFVARTIDELYDLEPGSFDPVTGGIRLARRGATRSEDGEGCR